MGNSPPWGLASVARLLLFLAQNPTEERENPMNASGTADDVKAELSKGLDKLTTLRDEARLHLHLASLDAKQEWDERLEPRINELQTSAQEVSDGTKSAVQDLLARVEGFVSSLRSKVAGEDENAKKS